MRIWAIGGLAQQSSSERLVDDGAKGSKDDLSLQGHYGLPVSCERFCRSVTAGRLPACVLCFFALILWGAVPTPDTLHCHTAVGCGRQQ